MVRRWHYSEMSKVTCLQLVKLTRVTVNIKILPTVEMEGRLMGHVDNNDRSVTKLKTDILLIIVNRISATLEFSLNEFP